MLRLILKILLITIFLQLPVLSETFKNILIKGNKRISDETILVFSEIPSNKSLEENSLNSILKKLYDSGFFNDVIVKIENNNLVIQVKKKKKKK